MFDPSKEALRARAQQRLRLAGISIRPPINDPWITNDHVDGPILHRLDGQLHWLSWGERYRVWRKKADAWQIERELQRKEWLDGRMPCVICDHFPYGLPPHAKRCPNVPPQETSNGN